MKINGSTVGTPTPRSNFNQTDPKKADYLVGREKIANKDDVAAATEEAKRIASAIEGGTMAFRILKVEGDGHVITLDSTEGLEGGMLCSADCGNNYNGFGHIGPGPVEGNFIIVDTPLTNYTVEEDSVLWIVGHPELGTTKIGEGAYNLGLNCQANQKGACSTGEDNISDGKRSFTANRGNYAGYLGTGFGSYNKIFSHNGLGGGNYNILYAEAVNALLMGYMNQFKAPNGIGAGSFNWGIGDNILIAGEHNTIGAKNNIVGGEYSQSYYERCLLFGLYLLSGRVGQTVFGDYNAPNDRDILQIGVGTGENQRANAFIVDKNRNTIGGTNNNILDIANKFNIFMYGEGLWTQNDGEASVGRYNISTPQTVFTVGIGDDNDHRKNGLAVEEDGRVVIGADPVYAMDVTTKQYVDGKIEHRTEPMYDRQTNEEIGVWHIYHDKALDTYDIYGYLTEARTKELTMESVAKVYAFSAPIIPPNGLPKDEHGFVTRKNHLSIKADFVGHNIPSYVPLSSNISASALNYGVITTSHYIYSDQTMIQNGVAVGTLDITATIHWHVEAE